MLRPGFLGRRAGGLATLLGVLAGLALALPRGGPASAPAPPAPAYLFLSPNTDHGLPLPEAARRLRSPAQERSRRLAAEILRQVGAPRAAVVNAVGDWSDGAENSLLAVVPDPPDRAALRY